MHLLTSGVSFFLLRPSSFSSRKHVNRQPNRTLPFDARYKNLKPFGFSLLKNFFFLFFFWFQTRKREREREKSILKITQTKCPLVRFSTLSAFFQQYGTKQNE
jgi:hypothetical protein